MCTMKGHCAVLVHPCISVMSDTANCQEKAVTGMVDTLVLVADVCVQFTTG